MTNLPIQSKLEFGPSSLSFNNIIDTVEFKNWCFNPRIYFSLSFLCVTRVCLFCHILQSSLNPELKPLQALGDEYSAPVFNSVEALIEAQAQLQLDGVVCIKKDSNIRCSNNCAQ